MFLITCSTTPIIEQVSHCTSGICLNHL